MHEYLRNSLLNNNPLPVDIVLHPSWWHHHEGVIFDKDFFFHPKKRVEVERKMEKAIHDRWGEYGAGGNYRHDLPLIGAVHLAAGFFVSEMLGCRVEYKADSAPLVMPAHIEYPKIDSRQVFRSSAFNKFLSLSDSLKKRFGYIRGDINWSGVLNIAIDLRGEHIFLDMFDKTSEVQTFFADIAHVLERFTEGVQSQTGSSSISVNRNVSHIPAPVFLHSECSHTMISVEDYEKYLLPIDIEWSRKHRPFGIHYCGSDPHRYVKVLAKIPNLDFLDVGWGGDVRLLREHLPKTFLNIRLSPVEIIQENPDDIRKIIIKLIEKSANPWLTGVCCINMDHRVSDEKITSIFKTVHELRQEITCTDA